jgi:electron transfer flavoprotein alpha/beta subunit
MKTVDEYREFARQCRKLAAKITDPNDRRATELMASAWDKVADEYAAKLAGKRK